jgi:hypothetical protein
VALQNILRRPRKPHYVLLQHCKGSVSGMKLPSPSPVPITRLPSSPSQQNGRRHQRSPSPSTRASTWGNRATRARQDAEQSLRSIPCATRKRKCATRGVGAEHSRQPCCDAVAGRSDQDGAVGGFQTSPYVSLYAGEFSDGNWGWVCGGGIEGDFWWYVYLLQAWGLAHKQLEVVC